MSWNNAGGAGAGKAVGIGETIGVVACLCVGVALCLFSRFQSLIQGGIRPTYESDT